MSERLIDQYRGRGLSEPICCRPGTGRTLLVIGSLFVIVGLSVVILPFASPFDLPLLIIGPFLLLGILYAQLKAFLRCRRKGLLAFSDAGIYSSILDIEFSWDDIGPAWVERVDAGWGLSTSHVMFVVCSASSYKSQLRGTDRLQFRLAERRARTRMTKGRRRVIRAFAWLYKQPFAAEDYLNREDKLHQKIEGKHDAIAVCIPPSHRPGLTADEVIEIIETENARRQV